MPIFSEKQRAAFDELRRRQRVESGRRTPAQRLAAIEDLLELARFAKPPRRDTTRADLETWARIKAQLRAAEGRR